MPGILHETAIGKHTWPHREPAIRFRDFDDRSRGIILCHEPRPNEGPGWEYDVHVGHLHPAAHPDVKWTDILIPDPGCPEGRIRRRGFCVVDPRPDLDGRDGSAGTLQYTRLYFEEDVADGDADRVRRIIESAEEHGATIPIDEACDRLHRMSWDAFGPTYRRHIADHRRRVIEGKEAEIPRLRRRIADLEAEVAAGPEAVELEWLTFVW